MKVLVTGANGMLGMDVCMALERRGHAAVPTRRNGTAIRLDVTSADECRRALADVRPDTVIHCAAYTDVDGAEREPAEAFRVNADGSRAVAAACAEFGLPLCAISTDFVFDGEKPEPYVEADAPNPINVYGASKLAGEEAIRQSGGSHWIVRTSWLFGPRGKCFPDTILRAAESRPELRVVADQRGTPTYTKDLAEALVRLIQSSQYGTYHVANAGVTTWYDFAREALRLAGKTTPVTPITSAEWPSPTRRPANSALRCLALETQGVPGLRSWQDALADYVAERRA